MVCTHQSWLNVALLCMYREGVLHGILVSKLPEPFASHVHAFPVAQVRPSDDIDYLTSASWWYRPGHDIARAGDSIRQVFTGRVLMRGRNHH